VEAVKARRSQPWIRAAELWLGCPAVTVLLAAYLLADAVSLPSYTVIGRFTRLEVASVPPGALSSYIVVQGNDLRIIDTRRDSAGELASLVSTSDVCVGLLQGSVTETGAGIWSGWTEGQSRSLRTVWTSGSCDQAKLEIAQQNLIEGPELIDGMSEELRDWIDQVRAPQTRSFVWWAPLRDGAALASAVLAVFSLRGWKSWLVAMPWSLRSRRRRRGACPVCGYDLRGIQSACPECGTEPRAHADASA
jgi:hypothetical protein